MTFLSMIENGQRELRRKSHILALAAALRVPPVDLIPWVLSGSDDQAGSVPGPVAFPGPGADLPCGPHGASHDPTHSPRPVGPCAADTTHDLLDCDCGYLTDRMKTHMRGIRDGHAAYAGG